MTFEQLELIEPIQKALTKEGYTIPTPIQAEAIPYVLDGYDLLGCAQTGTGKTAALVGGGVAATTVVLFLAGVTIIGIGTAAALTS